ncbi:MAG: acetylornithine transaminase [Peptococcaceae bacterium]|nr:acetylornithine transaminase [Peptococcaceae bacterium]
MNNQNIAAMGQEYVMNTYGRQNFALERGKGSFVWDADGSRYLDLVAGIAVNNVGHCHPRVVDAIRRQADKLIHCSNLYWIENQVRLAKLIADHSCGEKVFFCNSGAEANEGAIKLARKWALKKYGHVRPGIISAVNSFHGRTFGALTATGQKKYQKDFNPLTPGFKHVNYNDIQALRDAADDTVAAVLLETLQGEGGVVPAAREYMSGVKALCEERGMLLIIDEVQTGLGRTGKLFGYEHYAIEPDVFTLAKGLGGGFPIGALVARGEAAAAFEPGDHASTFGGNPLATAAGEAALSVILDENLSGAAEEKGNYIRKKLARMKEKYPVIQDIRVWGLMVGIQLSVEGQAIVNRCLADFVIINCIQGNVLRLVPPLTISYEEIDQALAVIEKAVALEKTV